MIDPIIFGGGLNPLNPSLRPSLILYEGRLTPAQCVLRQHDSGRRKNLSQQISEWLA